MSNLKYKKLVKVQRAIGKGKRALFVCVPVFCCKIVSEWSCEQSKE